MKLGPVTDLNYIPSNSQTKALMADASVFGDGVFKKVLRLNEIIRVGS